MKPAAFDYARPTTLVEAIRLLAAEPEAKVMAGGQTLGPMLNLRLAQPRLVVDISRIPELARVAQTRDHVVLGACVTHAAIEDGRVPDPAGGLMAHVARGIAYRAVRTRGTICGSLAHADPAADWVSCLTALDATVSITRSNGRRTATLVDFVRGAMESDLNPGEIVDGVRIPMLAPAARTGYHKICRKTGEFADAIGVAVVDPARGRTRLVAGATGGKPVVIDLPGTAIAASAVAAELGPRLDAAGLATDVYSRNVLTAAVQRALEKANAA